MGQKKYKNFQLSLGQIVYKTFNNRCNPVLHYTKDFCIKYFCTPENAGYIIFKKYCFPMNMILFNAIHVKMLQYAVLPPITTAYPQAVQTMHFLNRLCSIVQLKNYNFQTLLPSFMMIH